MVNTEGAESAVLAAAQYTEAVLQDCVAKYLTARIADMAASIDQRILAGPASFDGDPGQLGMKKAARTAQLLADADRVLREAQHVDPITQSLTRCHHLLVLLRPLSTTAEVEDKWMREVCTGLWDCMRGLWGVVWPMLPSEESVRFMADQRPVTFPNELHAVGQAAAACASAATLLTIRHSRGALEAAAEHLVAARRHVCMITMLHRQALLHLPMQERAHAEECKRHTCSECARWEEKDGFPGDVCTLDEEAPTPMPWDAQACSSLVLVATIDPVTATYQPMRLPCGGGNVRERVARTTLAQPQAICFGTWHFLEVACQGLCIDRGTCKLATEQANQKAEG